MTNAEKVLNGESVEINELDDEEQVTPELISNRYNEYNIVNSIGNDNFKEMFTMFISDIMRQPVENQRRFSYELINKLQDVYNFDLTEEINLTETIIFEKVYDFIYFIEIGIIDFLAGFWKITKMNLRKVDFTQAFTSYFHIMDNYINYILKHQNPYSNNEILTKFLLTNNKESLTQYFINKCDKNRIEILTKSEGIV